MFVTSFTSGRLASMHNFHKYVGTLYMNLQWFKPKGVLLKQPTLANLEKYLHNIFN